MKADLLLNILVFALLAPEVAFAVTTPVVKGRVVDEEERPVEYANVSISLNKRYLVAFGATNEDGKFNVKTPETGSFFLEVSCVGFSPFKTTITVSNETTDLGIIVLKTSSEEITSAKISDKQILSRQTDRLVYNVEADPDAARMNMMEFMSKIPGLRMSSRRGKLTYKGEALESILIDNKESGLINTERQYPMSFIRADYMSSIVLILPDSPEYRNKNPMLVLKLKEKLPYGAASEIRADAGSDISISLSPDIVINTPIAGIGINYGFDWSKSPELENIRIRESSADGSKVLESHKSVRDINRKHNLCADIFKSILNDKIDIRGTVSTSLENNSGRVNSITDYLNGNKNTSSSTSSVKSPFRFNGGLSITYLWKNGNSFDVSNTYRNSFQQSAYTFVEESTIFGQINNTSQKENNFSLRLTVKDQKNSIQKWSSNTASGLYLRKYGGSSEYGEYVSTMDYKQYVAFLSEHFAASLLKDKMLLGGGVTAEYIINRGTSHDGNNVFPLDYKNFNLIPNVYLMYKPAKRTTYNIQYKLQKNRPGHAQLNSNKDITDKEETITGNPFLKGSTTHYSKAEIWYKPRTKWVSDIQFSTSWTVTKSAIDVFSFIDGDGQKTTTFGNINQKDNLLLGLKIHLKPIKKMTLSLSGRAGFSKYSGDHIGNNSYWYYSFSEIMRTSVKKYSIIQEFSLSPYRTGSQTTDYRMDPQLSLFVSRFFKKINLGFEVGIHDILHGRKGLSETTVFDGMMDTVRYGRIGRNVSLLVYWQIGRFKNHSSVKHTSYDM